MTNVLSIMTNWHLHLYDADATQLNSTAELSLVGVVRVSRPLRRQLQRANALNPNKQTATYELKL